MFMNAAQRLADENAALQAQLVAGALASRQMCATEGEGTGSAVPPGMEELVASVEACLARPEAPPPPACSAEAGGEAEVVLGNTEVVTRVLVGCLLVAIIIGALLTMHNLDHLPRWLERPLFYALSDGADTYKLGGRQVSLSKLVAYRLDRWFSTNPYSKVA